MSEQYLILHKVRGEPSFDCAEKIMIGDEEGWITNSGYRAYPVWHIPLRECLMDDYDGVVSVTFSPPTVPPDWPDHFQVSEAPKVEINFGQILSGLTKFKFKRRM